MVVMRSKSCLARGLIHIQWIFGMLSFLTGCLLVVYAFPLNVFNADVCQMSTDLSSSPNPHDLAGEWLPPSMNALKTCFATPEYDDIHDGNLTKIIGS